MKKVMCSSSVTNYRCAVSDVIFSSNFQQACGYEFTNKLHRMFTDVSVSNDLCNKFNDYLASQDLTTGVGFSVQVLQAGAWPLQSNYPVQVPQVLEKSVHIVSCIHSPYFYRGLHIGRSNGFLFVFAV